MGNKLLVSAEGDDLVTLDDFMNNTWFLFKTVAISPYYGYSFKYPSKTERTFFAILLIISITQWFGEITYFVRHISELAVVDATEAVSHIEFGILCFTKVTVFAIYNKTISKLMFTLKSMFPKSLHLQEQLKVRKYLRTVVRTSKYWICYFFLAHAGFTVVPITQSCFEFYLNGNFSYLTPIHASYPFEYRNPVMYSLVYFHQFWGVYWIGAIILCTDLLLGSTLMQVCMHFDWIGRQFLLIEPGVGSLDTIRYLGRYHWVITRLSDDLCKIFSAILLLNVTTSACTICFIALQIVSADGRVHAANYVMTFLFLSAQVYQVSYFGSKLDDASENFSNAVYNHCWYSQSLEYKKAVLFILLRCAKKSHLTVGGFTTLSVATFGQVYQFSYKIFAILNSTN